MKRILNFGSLNTDYVYKVDHILQGGETIQSESRTVFPGGKGLNQSIALVRAGLSVCHAGLIGTDGEHLRDLLNQNGVDTSLIETRDMPGGHTVIQVSREAQNAILLFSGSNGLWMKHIPTACLRNSAQATFSCCKTRSARCRIFSKKPMRAAWRSGSIRPR